MLQIRMPEKKSTQYGELMRSSNNVVDNFTRNEIESTMSDKDENNSNEIKKKIYPLIGICEATQEN